MSKTCLTLMVSLLLLFGLAAQAQILFEIVYDDGNIVYYSGRPQPGDTCGVWFEPPTDSRICSTRFTFNDNMGGDAEVFIALMAPGFDPDNYYDSDEVAGVPGPTPIGEIIVPPFTYPFDQSGDWQNINWADWVSPVEVLDIGTQPFYVGWVLLGGYPELYYPSIMGDAADDRPYHSLTWLTNPGGAHVGESGWWAYGIDWFVRTTVDMYGDPPPVIEGLDDLPDTYAAGPYTISVTVVDDSTGGVPGVVSTVDLAVAYDGVATDTLVMTNISDSTYEATISAQPVGTVIGYQVIAEDLDNHLAFSPSPGVFYNFTYLEPSGAKILLVNDSGDTEGEAVYRWALESKGYQYDYWYISPGDPDDQGYPGTDVFDPAVYNSIIWFNGSGYLGSLPDNDATLAEDPIALFMDGGGNFFLSSSDYIGGAFNPDVWENFVATPGTFMYDYLMVDYGWSDSHLDPPETGESQDTMYIGIAGDPISDDFSGSYIQDMPDPNYNDWTAPRVEADTCFLAEIDAVPAGIRYDEGSYKMVFLPWVLEALVSQNVARGILVNVLEWFDEGKVQLTQGSRYGLSGEPAPFYAIATHPNTVNSVRLYLNPDETGWINVPMDATGNPNEYTRTIPAGQFTNTLDYYVLAATAAGDTMMTQTYECWATTFATTNADLLFCSDQQSEGYFGVNYDSTVTIPLNNLGITYDYWDADSLGPPDYYTVLSDYTNCFWVGYGEGDPSIFPEATADNPFTPFLMQGNNLLFSSEEMLGVWTGWADVTFEVGNFAHDWLHVLELHNDVNTDTIQSLQVSADPLVASLTPPVMLSGYGYYDWAEMALAWTDEFVPTSGTVPLFFSTPGSAVDDMLGFRDDMSQHNVITLGFPLFMVDQTNLEAFIDDVMNDYFPNNPGTGIEKPKEVAQPISYELQQNFPNPFNPITNIRFAIPENAKVELTIYNLMGQEVAKLLDRSMNTGWHNVTWDASQLASGIYFYKIKTANFEQARKMILVK